MDWKDEHLYANTRFRTIETKQLGLTSRIFKWVKRKSLWYTFKELFQWNQQILNEFRSPGLNTITWAGNTDITIFRSPWHGTGNPKRCMLVYHTAMNSRHISPVYLWAKGKCFKPLTKIIYGRDAIQTLLTECYEKFCVWPLEGAFRPWLHEDF